MSTVARKARIFRFGHFPEKGWGCTREEFVAANGTTGTIPIGFDPVRRGHYVGRRSSLDGRTGTLTFSVEGDEVLGDLEIPELIHEAVVADGLKLSAQFHPVRKTMSKVDFVETPYFEDAVLFDDGERAVVVFEGEDPEPEPEPEPEPGGEDEDEVGFCGDGGHEAHQTMHDLCGHGRPGLCSGAKTFARDDGESDDDRLFRQMHHHAVHHGAYCPGMPDGLHGHEEVGMSDEVEDVREDGETGDEVTFSEEEMTPAMRAMAARMKQLEAMVSAGRAAIVEKDAVTFAASVTRGENAQAHGVEYDGIVDGYRRAAAVDAQLAEAVTFSAGKEKRQGSHLDAFKALYLSRPKLGRGPKIASGHPDRPVTFSALDHEPDDEAARLEAAKVAREKERESNQAFARSHNPATPGR